MNKQPHNKPFLSVCTVTYNQQAFIAQCIESVLMQETDFEWELIIGDDGSTDGTGEICRQYAAAYPHRIRYYYRSREGRPPLSPDVYPNRYNLVETFKAANGQYIAWLDGDDYYTDVQQLQKVKQFFTTHPECKIVFTDAHDVDAQGKFLFDPTKQIRRNLVPADLILYGPQTSTLVMDAKEVKCILSQTEIMSAPSLDQLLIALLCCHSYAGYVQTKPVAYRYHTNNISKQTDSRSFLRRTFLTAFILYKLSQKKCVAVARRRVIIASRSNLKYNLLHFSVKGMAEIMRLVKTYLQFSGDWKFFIDFWNKKQLYQRSS